MPTRPSASPIWIATQDDLLKMTDAITAEPLLAIDTESNSLYAYRERVCLVQVSTPQTDYLVDPLALTDLSALGSLFADSRRQKIFHAAEYDILCLKRDYNFTFNNIFDTMIAARILSYPQVGLGNLLSAWFGIELEKKYQRADWGKRPLPQAMLDYARMDTHYLFDLRTRLERELKEKRLWELALEDFSLVCQAVPAPADNNGGTCWKVIGGKHLSAKETAVLQALCAYRDQQAQRMGLPHFKVLSNTLLLELSHAMPRTLDELKSVSGMNDVLLKRHGTGLLRAIEEGKRAKPPARPPRQRPEKDVLDRLKRLHEWRKTLAGSLKTESDVVLPRVFMERIASEDPQGLADLKELMADIPWRYRQYGKAILSVIQRQEEYENSL